MVREPAGRQSRLCDHMVLAAKPMGKKNGGSAYILAVVVEGSILLAFRRLRDFPLFRSGGVDHNLSSWGCEEPGVGNMHRFTG